MCRLFLSRLSFLSHSILCCCAVLFFIHSFKLLNKGKPSADPKQLEIMADEDLKYLVANAPQNPDGTYDYTKFTENLFSR
jgi:hypothetical protein